MYIVCTGHDTGGGSVLDILATRGADDIMDKGITDCFLSLSASIRIYINTVCITSR